MKKKTTTINIHETDLPRLHMVRVHLELRFKRQLNNPQLLLEMIKMCEQNIQEQKEQQMM